jgi:hypothetical protein
VRAGGELAFRCSRQPTSLSTCGLVAMTSASHAEGRQFDPGQVYFSPQRIAGLARTSRCWPLCESCIAVAFSQFALTSLALARGFPDWCQGSICRQFLRVSGAAFAAPLGFEVYKLDGAGTLGVGYNLTICPASSIALGGAAAHVRTTALVPSN